MGYLRLGVLSDGPRRFVFFGWLWLPKHRLTHKSNGYHRLANSVLVLGCQPHVRTNRHIIQVIRKQLATWQGNVKVDVGKCKLNLFEIPSGALT